MICCFNVSIWIVFVGCGQCAVMTMVVHCVRGWPDVLFLCVFIDLQKNGTYVGLSQRLYRHRSHAGGRLPCKHRDSRYGKVDCKIATVS